MRLKQLKLAGFKSFADATTLKFPNPLTAIVGPNGCGKSNVIDAIRWVMGESSAKQLRGGAMSDVIFAGSTSRKQMSYASVELVFEQTDDVLSAQLKNEYNLYHELSVRRQVSREGKSDYFINGTRCRKRDIVNIFLGTGLGARSYAVIEQGMITRLVDAKPDEMRVFIEEAAGVSKYQAKRVETSRHLAHAQDNLARLEDVKTELEKQIKSLQRQANAAEKYKNLHEEKKALEKAVLSGKYATAFLQKLWLKTELVTAETTFTEKREARLAVETEHVLVKKQLEEVTTAFQAQQIQWQSAEKEAIDAGHAHLQAIQNLDNLSREADNIEAQMRDLLLTQQDDKNLHDEISQKLDAILPTLAEKETELNTAQSLLNSSDIDKLTSELNDCQRKLQNLESSIHVADKQQKQLEKQRERNYGRQNQLKNEKTQIVSDEYDEQIVTAEKTLGLLERDINDIQQQLDTINLERQQQAERVETQKVSLNAEQQKVTRVETELSTLNRLQEQSKQQLAKQVAKQDVQKPLINELTLTDAGKPFAEVIEKLASDWLYAELAKPNDNLSASRYVWQAEHTLTVNSDKLTPLTKLVASPNIGLWQQVWLADTVDFALLKDVPTGGSILAKTGDWYGDGWLINLNANKTSNTLSAQISQEARIGELDAELLTLKTTLTSYQQDLQQASDALQSTDAKQQELSQTLTAKTKEKQQTELSLSQLQSKQASVQHEQTRIDQQLAQLATELAELEEEQSLLFEDKGEAQGEIAYLTPKKDELSQQLETAKQQFTAKQEQVEQIKEEVHGIKLDKQHLDNQKNSLSQALGRANSQVDALQPRLDDIKAKREHLQDELPELETVAIEMKVDAEKLKTALDENQGNFQAIQTEQNELSNQRDELFKAEEISRDAFTKYETDFKLAEQQGEQLLEQMNAFGDAFVMQAMNLNQDKATEATLSDADVKDKQARLNELDDSLSKIGGVNLAAAEDLVELKSRFERLNTQILDVEESVVKLTKAMQQIDMETRGLFLSTLQTVNANMKELFPKVFGGGQAELTLEDKHDWQSGVVMMAQPPGKKNSRLALLSGGEKTLTALSMVFSIFKINPAPFCVLDEVDAPLDDANIGRYCALVKELSKQVQFVFISHNKLAMEMANDMLGVTMPTAGVSKLVSVSLDEVSKFTE